MLATQNGNKRIAYVPDYVVFDLETTGLSWENDEIIEISAMRVRNSSCVDEFTTLVNPGIPVSPAASAVNGITDEMVEGAPGIDTVMDDFLAFIGEDILVGHNIHTFDLRFLQKNVKRMYDRLIGNDYIDTLEISRMYLPDVARHGLTDMATHYDIDTSGAHRALADCRMTMGVFECLRREIEHPSEAAKAVRKCPKCGSLLRKRSGRYGEFWGCSGYPACKFTENISSNREWK